MPRFRPMRHGDAMDVKTQHHSLAFDLAASTTSDGWVMLFPFGTHIGYDGRGPYVLTLEKAAAVVAASRREKVDLPLDWEHAMDVKGMGELKPAAGWIKDMRVGHDGIYGRPEWTPKARQSIADKEYRYLSPSFNFDRNTGEVMRIARASLVAVPNLEVNAIAAATTVQQKEKERQMDEMLKKLAALLGLPDDADHAAVLEAVQALKTTEEKVKEAVDAPSEATADEVVEKIEEKIEAEAEKKAETAIASAKKKMQLETASAKNNKVDPTKFVPIEAFEDVQTRLNKLETASASNAAQAAVDDAVKSGKVTPAMKSWALELASADMSKFQSFVKNAPVVIKAGASDLSANPPETASALSDTQMAVCSALGISAEGFVATAKKEAANK